MPRDYQDFLSKLKAEMEKGQVSLDKLRNLRQTTKNYFDDRINQLVTEYDLLKKIKVPNGHIKLWKYRGQQVQLPFNWRYTLSSPFIYGMIVPTIIWHVAIEIYHQVCFRLYGIPRVNPRDYFIYDRQLLSYLNNFEKINCIYCSYVNNVIRYSFEIGGRTERYWCPIKYYRRIKHPHSQYGKFADGKDPNKFRRQWDELREFHDLV